MKVFPGDKTRHLEILYNDEGTLVEEAIGELVYSRFRAHKSPLQVVGLSAGDFAAMVRRMNARVEDSFFVPTVTLFTAANAVVVTLWEALRD